MITTSQRSAIAHEARRKQIDYGKYRCTQTLIQFTIDATLEELNKINTPDDEPMPANTRYIDMGTNHLMTWDGATWRDDGPIDDVSHHLWQMIRDLQAKVAHLEATR